MQRCTMIPEMHLYLFEENPQFFIRIKYRMKSEEIFLYSAKI